MRMIFDADERIAIRGDYCEPKYMKKQDFADYLTENVKEDNCLERVVILNHLPLVQSIWVHSGKKTITLYPTYVRMVANKELYEFLYNVLMSK